MLTSTEGELLSVEKGSWGSWRYAIRDLETGKIKKGSFYSADIKGLFFDWRFDCKLVQVQYTD